ncbi:MAG: TetR/AcrR family transcriptional regulator [Lachnospiraceae bacterium]
MANRTEGLDEKIAESAYQEFMEYGFNDASTNRIAKNAGVTSGALYIRYKNKDQIFKSLVEPTLNGMDRIIESYKGKYSKLAEKSEWDSVADLGNEILDVFIDYIYAHQKMFILLVCKSQGSSTSNFYDKLISFKYDRILHMVERVKAANNAVGVNQDVLCSEEIALLCSAQYYTIFETIRHGYTKEQAKKYLHSLFDFYEEALRTKYLINLEGKTHEN